MYSARSSTACSAAITSRNLPVTLPRERLQNACATTPFLLCYAVNGYNLPYGNRSADGHRIGKLMKSPIFHRGLQDLVDARIATGDRAILKRVRRWRTAHGAFTAFYFRSERCRGADVPVYAVLGIPRGGGPFPGVLHYHGGGQTANPDLVEWLARDGYAAISFDWTGPAPDREHVTHWNGCTPRYSGMKPDEALLVRALTAARQALTILAEQPRVDAERLGQFGISWGGFQTWLLNALDQRLRAATAIYGCGITRMQAQAYFQDELKTHDGFDVDAWLALFNPCHYARRQHAPVLFLDSTNDFFGWLNTARLLFARLDDRHRAAFVPHLNHSIGHLNPTLKAWLHAHLRGGRFPGCPCLTAERTKHGLELGSPVLAGAGAATFYVAAHRGVGPDFFWRPVTARRHGETFEACVPNADLSAPRGGAFVMQRLTHGVETSSLPLAFDAAPGKLRPAPCQFLPLTPDLWYGATPVNPLYPFASLRRIAGRPGLAWTTGPDRAFQFNTRLIAQPNYLVTGATRLCAEIEGPVEDPITVAVLSRAGLPRERRFEGRFDRATLTGGIPLRALKDARGRAPHPGTLLSHLHIGSFTTQPGTARLLRVEWGTAPTK